MLVCASISRATWGERSKSLPNLHAKYLQPDMLQDTFQKYRTNYESAIRLLCGWL